MNLAALPPRAIAILLALVTAGCGGSDGGQMAPPPIVAAPAPSPSPSPTPSPTPVPSPTPTPSPAPTPTPVPGPLAAGAASGGSIAGPYACAAATLGFAERPSATPGLTSLTAFLGDGLVFDDLTFELPGVDRYEYGFVPTVFGPADKIASETGVYDQFVTDGELNIYRNQGSVRFDWATFGLVSNKTDGNLCAFSLGLAVSGSPTSGTRGYSGIADGVALVGGVARRMFGSPATMTFNHATGTGTVQLDLSGRADPFGSFTANQAAPIAVVSGDFTSASGRFSGTLRSAAGGITGTFRVSLFGPQGSGAGIAFALSDGAGTRIIGSAALAPN